MPKTATLRPASAASRRSPQTKYCTDTWMSAVVEAGKST
jgi:hypothetical protein